jgi:hypothetical protein
MTGLVLFTVIDVVLLIAGLAFYLFWVGSLLTRVAGNLEECAQIVRTIVGHAELIGPGVGHINETGGVVAGASPTASRTAGRRGPAGPWSGWVRRTWSCRSTPVSRPGRTAGRCIAGGRPR